MSECFSCLRDAVKRKRKLIDIKNVMVKFKRGNSEFIICSFNMTGVLQDTGFEKLVVSVNGKEVEIKL